MDSLRETHREVLVRAMSNVLSTDIAKVTYAQTCAPRTDRQRPLQPALR